MIPARIGQQCAGGTFTGLNRIGDYIYGIIVAPKSTEVKIEQKLRSTNKSTPGTRSTVDGLANTNSMNNLEHPAAHYCKTLSVSGFNDWYLPSKNELEISYRNLKPSTKNNCVRVNSTAKGNLKAATGTNLSSIPASLPYTTCLPAQTVVPQYHFGSSESFDGWYWTSTEYSEDTASTFIQDFSDRNQY